MAQKILTPIPNSTNVNSANIRQPGQKTSTNINGQSTLGNWKGPATCVIIRVEQEESWNITRWRSILAISSDDLFAVMGLFTHLILKSMFLYKMNMNLLSKMFKHTQTLDLKLFIASINREKIMSVKNNDIFQLYLCCFINLALLMLKLLVVVN